MATFVKINYFARGKNEENFTVQKKIYNNPWWCYINLDTIERITPIIDNDRLIVELDDKTSSAMKARYFVIHTISKNFYILKEEELSKLIQEKDTL